MISVEGLKVEFGVKPLFTDVSFVVNDRDRIALVGKNGAGKSTMLKILCGLQQPTSGVVSVPNDVTIGYLPQVMKLQDDTTVREETRKAFSDNTKMKARLKKMEQEMADRTDYESDDYAALVERFTQEHERYMMLGGENYEAEIERTLTGLGFTRDDFERPTKEFSGGWRMRIELAKILLKKPDVLLLDEPTNHLDIASKEVLKEAIKAFDGTAIIVSHDREFLDGLVSKVYEFGGGKVREHLGGIYDWLKSPLQLPPAPSSSPEKGRAPIRTLEDKQGDYCKSSANRAPLLSEGLGEASSPSEGSGEALSYAERKEIQKKIRKAQRAVEESESKIAKLEARKKELDDLLMTPENASNMELVTEYTNLQRELDEENERWLILSEELETLNIEL